VPKLKGFSNAAFKKEYNIITFRDLELLAKEWITEIDKKVLLEKRIIWNKNLWIKLLAKWDLKSKLSVIVDKASAGAIKAVEKASGKIEITKSKT
jgi:ribosomal protein L15